jgi:WD repeat-containing protein 89
MSLVQSPAFASASRPIKSTSLPSEAYVLSLAPLHSYYAASASAPSNAIHIFDKANLRPVSHLAGHGEAISAMRSVPNFAGTSRETLISCGKDGLVKVWDERSGSPAAQSEQLFFL